MLEFYWYEKCSTCKKAKKWLDDHQISYELKDIVKETPTTETFTTWLRDSKEPLRKFFNTSGMIYRQENLKDKMSAISIEEAANLLSARGMLVKRPLLVEDGKFLMNGFKEEKYEELLK